MSNKNFINVIYRRERNVVVTIRLDRNLVFKIDQISDNRSEFIRTAIEFYIKFHENLGDLINFLKNLGFDIELYYKNRV